MNPFAGAAPKLTTWSNPTQDTLRFEIHVDTGEWVDARHLKLRAAKSWTVVVPPRGREVSAKDRREGVERGFIFGSDGRVELPSEFDQGIQTLECKSFGCDRKVYCNDPTHEKIVCGGLCPQLQRVRPDGEIGPEAQLSPFLVQRRPTLTPDEVDDRLLARVKAGAK
jgi:hypothetical protein